MSSKKPIVIFGESFFELKSSQIIFKKMKEFLLKNNFINDKWNSLNFIPQNASTIGSLDLKFFSINSENNFLFFDKLENKKFDLLYLLGSDNRKHFIAVLGMKTGNTRR